MIYLNLGVDLTLDYNRTSLVKAMEYIAEAETPVLLHCMHRAAHSRRRSGPDANGSNGCISFQAY